MAADVGINVSLNGEKKFKDSIKDITQKGKTLDSEMKKVTASMDDNASTMKKNKAEAEVLSQQIENQKDKVSVLTEEYEKNSRELGENDRKTLALKEQLNKAETELGKMKDRLDEISNPMKNLGEDMKNLGENISKAGDKIAGFGKGVTAAVTAPIMGVGAAAMAAWNEYDAAADQIIIMTGATGEALDEMTSIMETLATTIPVSFDAASKAVGEVNTRFGATGDDLQNISEDFLKFAELNGVDVVQAIDTVQSAMAAWGIEADDTGAVLDTLNKVAQDTGTDALALADTLGTNVTTLTDMGYSFSDAANLLGALDKEGIEANAVMTGLNKAFLEGAKEGKSAREVIDDLTNTITNADSDTEAYAAAIDLFGKKAGPQLAGALRSGRLSLDELGTSITDNLGNVDETFAATLDPVDEFTTILNELKIVGKDVAEILMTAAVPVIEKVAEVVHDLKERWDGLSPEMQETIIQAAGIAAVVGPIITVIGGVVGGIGSIIGGLGSLIGVVGGFLGPIASAAFSVGEFGIALTPIGGIIAGVIAVGALLITHWDDVKAAAGWLKDTVSNAWSGMQTAIEEHGGGIQGFLGVIGDGISSAWSGAMTALDNATGGALTSIQTAVEEHGGGIQGFFGVIGDGISSAWSGAMTALDTATGGALTSVLETINANGGGLTGAMTTIQNTITTGWTTAWTTLDTFTGGKLTAISTAFSTGVSAWGETLNTWWSDMSSAWSTGWEGLSSGASEWLSTIGSTITTTFTGLITSALSWGSDMLDNFVKGLQAGWEWVKDGIKGIGEGITDRLGFSLPKEGPLSHADEWMPDMMALLAQGIRDNLYVVRQAAQEAATALYLPEMSAGQAQADTARELVRLNDAMESGATNVTVMLSGDAGRMLRVLSVENNRRTRATGYNALSGGMV